MNESHIALMFLIILIYIASVFIVYFASASYRIGRDGNISEYYLYLCKRLNILGKSLLFVLFIPALTFNYSGIFITWLFKKIFFKKNSD